MEKRSANPASASRTRFIDPDFLLGELDIRPGMKVAHFGCGTGYFTFAAARAVGPEGEVRAFDILGQKVDLVQGQARLWGLNNIFARRANLEERGGSKLPDECMDWVLLVNILYQNDNKSRITGEAKRVLKKDGRILVVEWSTHDIPLGPAKATRASREELIKILRKHGLGIVREIEVGQFHWGMVLVKN